MRRLLIRDYGTSTKPQKPPTARGIADCGMGLCTRPSGADHPQPTKPGQAPGFSRPNINFLLFAQLFVGTIRRMLKTLKTIGFFFSLTAYVAWHAAKEKLEQRRARRRAHATGWPRSVQAVQL